MPEHLFLECVFFFREQEKIFLSRYARYQGANSDPVKDNPLADTEFVVELLLGVEVELKSGEIKEHWSFIDLIDQTIVSLALLIDSDTLLKHDVLEPL